MRPVHDAPHPGPHLMQRARYLMQPKEPGIVPQQPGIVPQKAGDRATTDWGPGIMPQLTGQ
eukprot:4066620-Lingulodinium_polyedra.AAC.1